MNDLFYNAAPNETRTAPPVSKPREYPKTKPTDVYFFGTCVIDLFFPNAGLDAIYLLEQEGIRVHFPEEQGCCGQPAYTSGFIEEALAVARAQLKLFKNDWPVVVPSGSCAGMFHHHYEKLFTDQPEYEKAKALGQRTYELGEFLLHVCNINLQDQGAPTKIALHTSCTARREMNTHLHVRELIKRLKNVTLIQHDHESECCGFGGTFSVKMPDVSGAMVLDKTKSLANAQVDQIISADCGCLMNINGAFEKQQQSLQGEHLATFLWQRIGGQHES